MANTKRINQVLEKLSYQPEEGKTIVVSYAPENLSDRIRRFFEGIFSYNNFYALSFCKESIVLLPFSAYWPDVKKKVALELPFSSIRGVEVSESGLDYRIDIQLDNEVISLMTQQAELSAHRASGCLSIEDYTFVHNWHTKNLKGTLQVLQGLGC
ncbi:MAG: hypothetical protein HDR05_06265 [Lachnospiraceae bacterium]|nr:hypothetical protein [Lachnospiraceae bacterium]